MNGYYGYDVFSRKGKVHVEDLDCGDKVYNYYTGKLVEIKGLHKHDLDNMYKIKYNDGREQIVHKDSRILVGTSCIRPHMLLSHLHKQYMMNCINQMPLELKPIRRNPKRKLFDPYVLGVIYGYSDFTKEEVTIPYGVFRRFEKLRFNQYYMEFEHPEINNLYVTFNYGDNGEKLKHRIGIKDIQNIVLNYTYQEKLKFLRGIFDMGYYPTISTSINTLNTDEDRLKFIREILNSIGIIASVEYYFGANMNKYPVFKDFNYILKILSSDTKSEFFSNINNIYNSLGINRTHITSKTNYLSIEDISQHGHGWTFDIVMENRMQIYFDSDFLPRVSY